MRHIYFKAARWQSCDEEPHAVKQLHTLFLSLNRIAICPLKKENPFLMLLSWSLFNVLAKVSNAKIMGLNFKPTCASECASYCAAEPELWSKVYMSLRSSSWSSWPSTVMDPWIKQQHTYVQTHSYGPEPKNEHNYWAAYNIHHFMEKKWTIK